jgi:hypothetical protein
MITQIFHCLSPRITETSCICLYIERIYSLRHQGDEAVIYSETLICVYQTALHNTTDNKHLHTRHRENLKSH